MTEAVVVHKAHTTPLPEDNVWLEFFQHGFTPTQASLLCEMLRGCGSAWRSEWEENALDAVHALQEVLHETFLEKLWDDVAKHRDALLELRAQMTVLLANKTIDGNAVEIPKFINGEAVVQKKIPERDVLVDRIADIEKLAARMEKQTKSILHRLSSDKRHLLAQAMMQNVTKRVDKLEAQIKQIDEVADKRMDEIEGALNASVR